MVLDMDLICEVCAKGETIRSVFRPTRSPQPQSCGVCGETLPTMENGFSSGRPADADKIDRLRAQRGLPALRRTPPPPRPPDRRVGDGYVLIFEDGQAELHIVTTARRTDRGGGFHVTTFEQTTVETRGDAEAVRAAARHLGITEERHGHRLVVTSR